MCYSHQTIKRTSFKKNQISRKLLNLELKTVRRHSCLDKAFSIENITLSRTAVPKFKAIPRLMLSLLCVGNASSVFPTYLHIMFIYEKPDKKQRSLGITYSLNPFKGLKLNCSKIYLSKSRVQTNSQGNVT